MNLPPIGLVHADGTATLSRDEVAWLRETFRRFTTAFGEATCSAAHEHEPDLAARVEEHARRGAAHHIAADPECAIMGPRVAITAFGEEVDRRSPAASGIRFRAEITVLRGGLPPAPPSEWAYTGAPREIAMAFITDGVPACAPIPAGDGVPVIGAPRS